MEKEEGCVHMDGLAETKHGSREMSKCDSFQHKNSRERGRESKKQEKMTVSSRSDIVFDGERDEMHNAPRKESSQYLQAKNRSL